MKETVIGFIGGSGLYELEGLEGATEKKISTHFGEPSDSIVTGTLLGKRVAFLPRHGKGHRFLPSEVNYRANIYALKSLGVTHIVSISAVGSLREELPPGMIVVPEQILDRTVARSGRTFFGNGIVGHVGFADPFCPDLRKTVIDAALKSGTGVDVHDGGTLVVVEGPRFSSRAESHNFRAADCSIIGMTAMPEAILAREAEIAYCTMALVTDYDCWREEEAAVDVTAVVAVVRKNVENSKKIVRSIVELMPKLSDNPIFSAAQYAVMTAPECISEEAKEPLRLLYGKYW